MRPIKRLYNILKQLNIGVLFYDRGDITYSPVNIEARTRFTRFQNAAAIIRIPMGLQEVVRQDSAEFELRLIKDIAHELGHYLVVNAHRRRLLNYGIPEDPMIDEDPIYELEEEKASIIARGITRRLGFKCGIAPRRVRYFKNKYQAVKWWNTEGKRLVDDLFKNERSSVTARRRVASPILGAA